MEIDTYYGFDPASGQWMYPLRALLGVEREDFISPVLEERLCLLALRTGSYEAAADVAQAMGIEADDSTIHRYVMRAGKRALEHEHKRVERALDPSTRRDVVEEAAEDLGERSFSLVIEMDGWMMRERGPQWGLKPSQEPGQRVEWHESKTATIFRVEDRAETQCGRRMLVDRFVANWPGNAHEFGRRVHAEALRRGLAQAQAVWVVADGGIWIWNIVEDRFSQARGVLDFYHASQHLWAVAHCLHCEDETAARKWVEPLLHQLRHGEHGDFADFLQCQLGENAPQECAQEIEYFRSHRNHMNYDQAHEAGCPIGSGAVESTNAQLQTRFKRSGQFWNHDGAHALMALELARRNRDWDDLWAKNW